jgi:putative tryptophan/tyrosine transport system substrate-binding protein
MQRREFIAGLGIAAAWPVVALAQQTDRMRRIGILMRTAATETEYQSYLAAFIQELRQLGWTQGQNLRVDVRWTAGDIGLAGSYAAQLIELEPDVIVAASTDNLVAVRQLTNSVPVVFLQVADPVTQRFVASMRQPGGNVTGFSLLEFSLGGKWLGLLKEAAPGLARVAVMFDPDMSPQYKSYMMPAIETAARSLGVHAATMPVRTAADIEPSLTSFARASDGGLILLYDGVTYPNHAMIAELLRRFRLPSIGSGPDFAKAGGLMDYGPRINLTGQYRQAAGYVDRILKGAKPGDLPVQAPDKYTFIVNLKTAKALGLTIPDTLLATADEVIE